MSIKIGGRRPKRADLEREILDLRECVKAQDAVIAKLVAAPAPAFYPCPLQYYPAQAPGLVPFVPFPVFPSIPALPGPYEPPYYGWEITCSTSVVQ